MMMKTGLKTQAAAREGRISMASKDTILIVEDERLLSDAYATILGKEGYEVAVAYDGEEALAVAAKNEPSVILLDLRMPRMGGIEFLRQYDLKAKHPDVKVIVFSNLDTQSEIDEAFALGAQKYMLKAWASPRELAKLIKQLLGR